MAAFDSEKPAAASATSAMLNPRSDGGVSGPEAALHLRMGRLETAVESLSGDIEELRADISGIRGDIRDVLQADIARKATVDDRRQARWDKITDFMMTQTAQVCGSLATWKGLAGTAALILGSLLICAGYGDDVIDVGYRILDVEVSVGAGTAKDDDE